jgi:hypothetical protein
MQIGYIIANNTFCESKLGALLRILHSASANCIHYWEYYSLRTQIGYIIKNIIFCECKLGTLLRILQFANWLHYCEYYVLRMQIANVMQNTRICQFSDSLSTVCIFFARIQSVGRDIARAVSRWLTTAAARVRARVRSCGICSGQSGTGAGFLRVLRFPLPIFIPPIALQSPSSIRLGIV